MPKRLVICCDGTWNTPDQVDQLKVPVATNVSKLAFAIRTADEKRVEQRMFYGTGVGTGQFDQFVGGAFGVGLSDKIKEAYLYLVDNYEHGDELFLFGFSRGAYTARSLAGLIRNSGILKRQYARRLDAAYDLYRDRTNITHPRNREATLFRTTYAVSVETPIKFIGVWDTVGALGIPDLPVPAAVSNYWKFHDVSLSTRVQYAYQALALDEKRKPFLPTLWDQDDNAPHTQRLEQVWFTGVHSDIGGGYSDARLSDITLEWLMGKAEAAGLSLDRSAVPGGLHPDLCGRRHNSMSLLYRPLGDGTRWIPAVRFRANHHRMRTHEYVSSTAKARCGLESSRCPRNLREYLQNDPPVEDIRGVPCNAVLGLES